MEEDTTITTTRCTTLNHETHQTTITEDNTTHITRIEDDSDSPFLSLSITRTQLTA